MSVRPSHKSVFEPTVRPVPLKPTLTRNNRRVGWLLGIAVGMLALPALAVMYNRDTGDTKSQDLADLQPFASKALGAGCTAVLIAPNALLCASHCTGYEASGTTQVTWNGQTKTGAAFTRIGSDHIVIVTPTPFTGTKGKMTAPYSGTAELNRLAWKVGAGGHGVIGPGSSGPDYDSKFRAMCNRIEVNNVSPPPDNPTGSYLYYDFDGPPSSASRTTTLYEGGTAPGDSGGPLYMFENGRWYVIGVTSGPDAGYYRDGRVRTDVSEIQSITGYVWARPTTPALEARWVAQDITATVANGAAVASWERQGGGNAWTSTAAYGAVGTATLHHAATPKGTAAVDFPGTARLGMIGTANPVASETAFTVAMVVQADASGVGAAGQWHDNTGLLDAGETAVTNDWGLAFASTGKPGLGVGNTDTTVYAPGASLVDGKWHVIVASWDGSEVSGDASGTDKNIAVYVDSATNVARAQGPEFINVRRNSGSGVNLTLGGSRTAANFFNGRIAEVRLYRGALNDAAVDALINELQTAHLGTPFGFALTRPAGGRATVKAGHGLTIDGTATGAGTTVAITQTSGPATASISPANTLPATVTFSTNGIYQFNVAAGDGVNARSEQVLVEVLNNPAAGSSPQLAVGGAWTASNLGDATTTGSHTIGSTNASLTGAGLGFEEVSDSLRFVWKPLLGDGTFTVRVKDFTSSNSGKAFGGIMLRSSLRRESANVAATVLSGGGLSFTRRAEDASYTQPTTYTLAAPYWVRVKRIGNTFTGFRSADGVTWVQQGTDTVISTMPASALWGLAVTAHDDTTLCIVDFDNVLLEPLGGQGAPTNGWVHGDLGTATSAGSHTSSSGATFFTVNGGGADFFGTADEGYQVSRWYSGDAQMTTRVVSQERTHPAAKAGVMVRASTNANAIKAMMAVTPLSGISFQNRTTTGGSTASDTSGTANFTAPYWLRLVRSGDQFTCFRSTNGTDWAKLGPTVTISNAPDTMFAGMLVASSINNSISGVNFDNLSLVRSGPAPVAPLLDIAAGQNPSVSNNFTVTATCDRSATFAWEHPAGPGSLWFSAQNTLTPQVAFNMAGSHTLRVRADDGALASFLDRPLDLKLDARWGFDTAGDAQGWVRGGGAGTVTVAGGLASAPVTGSDPQMQKLNACYTAGDLASTVLVRYRSTATGTAQLYWGRSGANSFAASRVLNADYPATNTWSYLVFTPGAHAEWLGQTITSLRFDPTGGAGSAFDIDSITLSNGDLDGDGIPDWWTTKYFGHPTGEAGDHSLAGDSPAGDGLTNLQKYLLGLNPLVWNNLWFGQNTRVSGGGIDLEIYCAVGSNYVLRASTDLVNWTNLLLFSSTNSPMHIVDPAATNYSRRFYRAVLQ